MSGKSRESVDRFDERVSGRKQSRSSGLYSSYRLGHLSAEIEPE